MAKGHGESRIFKVTLKDRANQLRTLSEPGRDYFVPIPSGIVYELSFFVGAAANIMI